MKRAREFLERWAGWLTMAGAMIGIAAWALLIFTVIGDPPRHWTYVNLPDVPSQSFWSTERPAGGQAPPQIEPTPRLLGGGR